MQFLKYHLYQILNKEIIVKKYLSSHQYYSRRWIIESIIKKIILLIE